MTKRRKGYSYLRYSSPKQTLGDSERRQFEETKKWADELGIEIDETLVDRGASGYHGHHRKGHWGTFLKRVNDGEIERGGTLFVEALDRMSREKPRIALHGFLDLVNAGIEIRTTIDRQHFTAESIDANDGQLHMTIGLMRGAHAESANKARRVKDAHKANRGKPSDVSPAWIRQNPSTPTGYEVIPDCQATIDEIFKLCIEGWGLNRIAAHLNKKQTPTFASRKRQSSGWYDVYIRLLVTQRLILGEVTYHEIIEGRRVAIGKPLTQYPAAVSEAIWQAANDALAVRRRTGGRHIAKLINLFQGISVCRCGARMRVQVRRKLGRQDNVYLQCPNGKRHVCDNRRYYAYRALERTILQTFGTAVYEMPDQSHQQTALLNKIAAAKHEADELAKAYKEANRIARTKPSKLADESVAESQDEHTAKLKQIDDLEKAYRRIAAEPKAEQLDQIRAMIRDMHSLTGDARDQLRTKLNADFRRFCHRIVFKPDGRVTIEIGGPVPDDGSFITVSEPVGDVEYLTTPQQIMEALKAGHSVGVA
jgi:hypothetical protein